MIDLLISVITRDIVHAETAQWLCDQPYSVDIVKGYGDIPDQRTKQVKLFLAGAWEWVFILDNDVVPKTYTIEKLMERRMSRVVVVAPPLTLGRTNQVFPMAYKKPQKDDGIYYPITSETQSTIRQPKDTSMRRAVDLTGMSGALLSHKMLREIGPPWFKTTHDAEGRYVGSEDVFFWSLVKEAGWEIEVQLDLVADHIKLMKI
jgi:GT2 family glycosyltransferase